MTASLAEFYYGTSSAVTPGSVIVPGAPAPTDAEATLDTGRRADAVCRCLTVSAASGIKDATALAAIRSYSRSAPVPHAAIRVYRVQLVPLHIGPVALIGELQNRLAAGRAAQVGAVVREYWEPTRIWYLQEVLASHLTVLEETPAADERDIYKLRWVQYNQDCERAQSL